MSTSAELLAELLAGGLNYADVGKAINRNRSYVRQVAIGAKPGANLTGSLTELRARLAGGGVEAAKASPVAEPAHRTTKAGRVARVRRPTTIRGRGWQSSTVRRQASRSGAGGMVHVLEEAAAEGKACAVTVTFVKRVTVTHDYGRRGRSGQGGVVDFELGPASAILAELVDEYGGNFTELVIDHAHQRGFIPGTVGAGDVETIEMRTY